VGLIPAANINIMKIDKLFIRTVSELKTKISSNDTYELVQISILLRKLLLDREPLIYQIAKEVATKEIIF
jgi:hypothetical protein